MKTQNITGYETFAIAFLLISLSSSAQKWRMGVTAGGDVNTYCIDTQYQYDWRYKDASGISMGKMGQYKMNDWFAVRADLNYPQKKNADNAFS